jgi:hypothetical protein
VRWAKLRGTPGSPQDKLTEAEREVGCRFVFMTGINDCIYVVATGLVYIKFILAVLAALADELG